MLKTPVIHPTIMEALARSGHFAQVVIADGNLPVGAMTGPNSTTVHLNFRPGLLDAHTVLKGILEQAEKEGKIYVKRECRMSCITYSASTLVFSPNELMSMLKTYSKFIKLKEEQKIVFARIDKIIEDGKDKIE